MPMSQPDALLMRAVRETADSFNDALQVILLEVEFLAHHKDPGGAEAVHLARLTAAAHKAARLSHAIFGSGGPAGADTAVTCDGTLPRPKKIT